MIDWLSTVAGALWIIGGAIGLATVSYAHWEAQLRGESLRVVLAQARMQTALNAAAILFCTGQLGSVSEPWERVLWGILAVAFGVQEIAHRKILER